MEPLQRTVVLIFGNINELDKKTISLRRRLKNQISETVNNNVNKEIEIICNNYLKKNIIQISINVRNDTDQYNYLDAHITGLLNPDEVRLAIYFQPMNVSPDYEKTTFYANNNISHLVEVKPNKVIERHGWFEGDNVGLSQIRLGVHQDPLIFIPKIVEDILLDIALFHLYKPLIVKNNLSTIELSILKKDYAKSNNLNSIYGAINDGSQYFSFASVARSDAFSFNTKRYVDIWYAFVKDLNFKLTNKNSIAKKEFDDNTIYERDMESVMFVFKNHYRLKQIRKKLLESILDLEDGEYVMINLNKSYIKRSVSSKRLIEGLFECKNCYGKFLIKRSDKLHIPHNIKFIVNKFYFNVKINGNYGKTE